MKRFYIILFTLFALIALPSYAQTRDQVSQAQAYLSRLGYNPGAADGLWGTKTQQAVISFMSERNLGWDGVLNEADFLLIQFHALKEEPRKSIATAITLHDVGGWHEGVWQSGLYESSIERIAKSVHANTLTIVDTHFFTELSDNNCRLNYSPDNRDWTPNPEQWQQIGASANEGALNLQMLIMSENMSGQDKWPILEAAHVSKNNTFWDTYFSEYTRLVTGRAQFGAAVGLDSIILGYNGSIDLAQNFEYWDKLIHSIKNTGFEGDIGIFTGLDSDRNWSGIKKAIQLSSKSLVQKNLDLFDFVVFQIQDAQTESLKRSLKNHADFGLAMHLMIITPSVATGISSGEYIEPVMGWNNATNSLAPLRTLSFQTQVSAYQAAIDVINDPKYDYVVGLNSWGYHFRDDLHYVLSPNDSDYEKSANIRGKPAEELVAEWYQFWQ